MQSAKESTVATAHRISTVVYETGSPHSPKARNGKLTATFDYGTGSVLLQQEIRDQRRTWRASLPEPTWHHLIATLMRSEFPKPPPPSQPHLPGVLFTTISWVRNGVRESVDFANGTSNYGQVNKVVMPIIVQLAPELDEGIPKIWFTPDTRIESPVRVA